MSIEINPGQVTNTNDSADLSTKYPGDFFAQFHPPTSQKIYFIPNLFNDSSYDNNAYVLWIFFNWKYFIKINLNLKISKKTVFINGLLIRVHSVEWSILWELAIKVFAAVS